MEENNLYKVERNYLTGGNGTEKESIVYQEISQYMTKMWNDFDSFFKIINNLTDSKLEIKLNLDINKIKE